MRAKEEMAATRGRASVSLGAERVMASGDAEAVRVLLQVLIRLWLWEEEVSKRVEVGSWR